MACRFLLDSMLGSLARWLRMGGLDAEYRRDADDDGLLEEAELEGRILLTGDEVLAQRARKRGLRVLLVHAQGDVEALRAVSSAFGVSYDALRSRCPRCNGVLEVASPGEVEGLVPEGTLRRVSEFWVCPECRSVYWRGSHWDNIQRTLGDAAAPA